MEDLDELWSRCSLALKDSVSDAVWNMWLSKVQPVDMAGDNLTLGVPNSVVRTRVNDRFLGLIRDAASGESGRPLEVLLIIVDADDEIDLGFDEPEDDFGSPGPPYPRSTGVSCRSSDRLGAA